METSLKEFLKKEAAKNNMYISEYCRQKIRDEPRLQRIEKLLSEIKKKLFMTLMKKHFMKERRR